MERQRAKVFGLPPDQRSLVFFFLHLLSLYCAFLHYVPPVFPSIIIICVRYTVLDYQIVKMKFIYPCGVPGCGYIGTKKDHLKAHMRTHTGERPFPCEVPGCGYSAAQSDTLKNHMRTHTGERPYPCDVPGCGYSATRSGSLKAHMRTHTGERPYPCEVPGCGYSAKESGILKRHIRTHG